MGSLNELSQYAPSVDAYVDDLYPMHATEIENKGCYLTAEQLAGYQFYLLDFVNTKRRKIGWSTNQLLYHYYGFPLGETVGCFFIDFELWHMVKPTQLTSFRAARDLFFDRDLNNLSYAHQYELISSYLPQNMELGYFANMEKAFGDMCQMAKYDLRPKLNDIIRWHDIATKHLSVKKFRKKSNYCSVGFGLYPHNSSKTGLIELLDLGLVTADLCVSKNGPTIYGCHLPYIYRDGATQENYIRGAKIYDIAALHTYVNRKFAQLEKLFLTSTINEDDKLETLIFFIKFFEVNHFFDDGNTRICILILYYFLIRFRLPLTILSDPCIFDGCSIDEILSDLKQGRQRYEQLRCGNILQLKGQSLSRYQGVN